MPLRALILLGLVVLVASACATVDEQIRIANTSSCIGRNCHGEHDAPGYQQCEAACRATYGR